MQIEPIITTGNILNTIVSILTVGIAAWTIIAKISRMEQKLNMMWGEYKKQRGIIESEN